MNNRHPWQLKKSKFLEPFWSYQLYSTVSLDNLAQFWGRWAGLAVLLAGSSKTAPRIFLFFQLSWVQNIYLMWNSMLLIPSHFLGILFQSLPVWCVSSGQKELKYQKNNFSLQFCPAYILSIWLHIKFVFSKKTTKIDEIFTVDLTLTT